MTGEKERPFWRLHLLIQLQIPRRNWIIKSNRSTSNSGKLLASSADSLYSNVFAGHLEGSFRCQLQTEI